MGTFLRSSTGSPDSIIGGPARILIAPISTPIPTRVSDIIQTETTPNTAEVQTVTVTGTPTGGTFTLTDPATNVTTAPIAYNAASTAVASALNAAGITATATGGPLPTAVVVTYTGAYAGTNRPSLIANASALTGGTSPSVTVAETTPGSGQYDPVNGWIDLGATKNGIQIVRNNAETAWDVDQVYGDIRRAPTSWEQSVRTSLSQATLSNFAYTWETLQPTFNPTTGEEILNLGAPVAYTPRRLAVLFQKDDAKIRAFFFRRVTHTPQESSVNFQKASEQVTLPVAFACQADDSSASIDDRFGFILNQK